MPGLRETEFRGHPVASPGGIAPALTLALSARSNPARTRRRMKAEFLVSDSGMDARIHVNLQKFS
jgi:hypothetical protein